MSFLMKILGYLASKANDLQDSIDKVQDNYSSKSDAFLINELRRSGSLKKKLAAKKELFDRGYSNDEINNLMK